MRDKHFVPGFTPRSGTYTVKKKQDGRFSRHNMVNEILSEMACSPAGALLGSVTSQISAIHLTQEGQETSSSSSASPLEEFLVVDRQHAGQHCDMQVDGEEELLDDLETLCSDDDDSSSINDTMASASVTSLTLHSGIEESVGEEDLQERPALVPSLFPLIPPTLYFGTAEEKVNLLPAEQMKLLKWKMSTITPKIVKATLARSNFKVTQTGDDWLGFWGHCMKTCGFKTVRKYQKVNHYPGIFQIGRKDRLCRNLSRMRARCGRQEFNFFPRSFILPQDIKQLRKAWEDSSPRQKWIIKPPASARGEGIQVVYKWSQVPRKRALLVQEYLQKPYLINGSKFDLRIYVYVTSYDPLRIYIFTDGLVRFASCKYSSSVKTLHNRFIHLTNFSVNKHNCGYKANGDSQGCQEHKWALKALWRYLGSKGINTSLLWEKIKDIVIKTIIASEPYVNSLLKMNVSSNYSCHELLGFDIILDEKLKPWLLEVNVSPSLNSSTGLDVSVKGQMVRDLLNLAGFLLPQKEDMAAPSSAHRGNKEKSKPDVSANEKDKQVFYLTQRSTDQDILPTVLDVLTPGDIRVLAQSEDEMNRRGQFERIFPSPVSSRYLRFFECRRYFNILLDQWEQKYWANRTKGISLLTALCQSGAHQGTGDLSPMWNKNRMMSTVQPHTHRQEHRQVNCPCDEDSDSHWEVTLDPSPNASPGLGSSSSSISCASP
ncbi:tubulin monoglutamylase TTLL4 isoform X2 [Genypterus blacodes]|uniref:tubulin monoglutamylase TTLL4 isoform X2 n=1 Tax=Genypterus blacodes TaxID=154954 RepID=UPI003F772EF5